MLNNLVEQARHQLSLQTVSVLLIFAVLVIGASRVPADEDLPGHESFAVGMSRELLVERFGTPVRTRQLRKLDDSIWGAIEDFWSGVAEGSMVEIWHYRSTHEWAAGSGRRDTGTTELYFVDGSPVISGLSFAPDGVIYESQ